MNIRKNFEAVFLVAVALSFGTTFALAKVPAHQAVKQAQAKTSNAADSKMTVVTVAHKRLSAAEKAALN